MAAVSLDEEEIKDFERFRSNSGGFPADDKKALAFFIGLKTLAASCYDTNESEF